MLILRAVYVRLDLLRKISSSTWFTVEYHTECACAAWFTISPNTEYSLVTIISHSMMMFSFANFLPKNNRNDRIK